MRREIGDGEKGDRARQMKEKRFLTGQDMVTLTVREKTWEMERA